MRRITGSIAAAAIAALMLTGCMSTQIPGGGSSDKPTSSQTDGNGGGDNGGTGGGKEITVAPATGTQLSGTGYSFNLPAGWTQRTDGVKAPIELMALNESDSDGFSDNLNVIKSPAGKLSAEQVETAGKKELEQVKATDITIGDRVNVAGNEAAHLSAKFTQQGVTYATEQYGVSNASQTYIVTFSFSESLPQADREKLAESVLATWNWS